MVLLDGAIMLYQLSLSPWLGPVCRYEPTCSHYARAAFRLHGFRKGGKMALRRVLSCRPGGGYGFDPVPMPSATSPAMAAKKIPHRLGQPE
ncbi:MAG: membrane protein insertion efficiency factor YidD [Candidatus Symbiobacter sp.]|nr:membrane protein insertion efficiency factor YidD [Candidatus Symbiobacter sp.]